jgi:hypothetical protein
VKEVAPAGGTKGPITEHAPEWHVAKVAVESVLKGGGRHAKSLITIRFPASSDALWFDAAKLSPGDERVFCLRSTHGAFTALAPGDVRPAARAAEVKRLVQDKSS